MLSGDIFYNTHAGLKYFMISFLLLFLGCSGVMAKNGNENDRESRHSRTESKVIIKPQNDDWWKSEAREMVREQIKNRGVSDERVLEVMRKTPRHKFVPERYKESAYMDSPLPIGEGQTISQPYIVGLMTSLLDIEGDEKVLEIGTGSGYQAAILSQLAEEVYTIEVIRELANMSEARLKKLNYGNVHVKWGDGYQGWPEHAPFDRIIVTAAPDKIPGELVKQLKPGGKMVLPVGRNFQVLKVVRKTETGRIKKETVTGVRFVPMVHPDKPITPDDK